MDPNYFPLGIALMVSEVFDELMQSNSVTPGVACESGSGLYSVVCLKERLMPASQKNKANSTNLYPPTKGY